MKTTKTLREYTHTHTHTHTHGYFRENKAITLVALVVTIVVLIILATISISIIFGEEGILERARQTEREQFKATARENIQLALVECVTDKKGKKLENADLIDEEKGLHAKDNNITLNEDNVWTGIYSDGTMQIEFSIDKTTYEVTFTSDVLKAEESLEEYIIYDANGGENAPKSQTKINNTISNSVPTRDNYVFAGWGTSSSSQEVLYKGGETYNGEENITLYAVWLEKLEYLESNGLQYIDTGFYPNQDTSIEFVATPMEDTKGYTRAWFGGRNTVNATDDSKTYTLWENNRKFVSYYNNANDEISEIDISTDTKYTIYMNKNVTSINGVKYTEFTYVNFTSPATLTLFGVKTYIANSGFNETNSVDYRIASLRLYSCKIWDNDTLVREYIPVKDFNGKECLYDNKNKKFYYFENIISELEYIESTGTQYIDTGFYPNQDTSIEFVATPMEDTEGYARAWFGGRNTINATDDSKTYTLWENNRKFVSYYNNANDEISEIDISTDTKYTIYMNKNVTSINGVKYTEFTYANFSSPATLTLFGVKTYIATSGVNEANSVDKRMSSLRLYSCKIWDNDTLVREYIPAKDGSGIVCLFDKVDRKFYYNQGSGTFIAGD